VSADERVAARRRALLDAGLELYGTRGIGAAGVKDVCREAGLTDRYFYESFRDGEALFLAVFDEVTDELFTAVARAVAAVEPEPRAQLRTAIATFLGILSEDPRRTRVVFSEAAAAGVQAERHMREDLRRFASLVAATARTHLPGEVPAEMVQLLALSLVGTLERVVVEWQDDALTMSLDDATERCVELYMVVFEGLSAAC
jgi:AcrR family transcriptional regulator